MSGPSNVANNPQLVRALHEQLQRRDVLLGEGAHRIGWKLGLGDRDRMCGRIGVGHLTTATCLSSGDIYAADGARELSADAEVAVELLSDIQPSDDVSVIRRALGGYSVALEICDIAPLENEPYAVIANNDFHRAVAFGEISESPPDGVRAKVVVNNRFRRAGTAPSELEICKRLQAAALVLAAVGEQLCTGDRIITSSVISTSIQTGDDVAVHAGALGSVRLRIT